MFERRGGGAIVNIASIAGLVGAGMPGNNVGNLAHCVAKAAVIRMTEVLAVELARFNVRVNGIAPGVVATPRSRRSSPTRRPATRSSTWA